MLLKDAIHEYLEARRVEGFSKHTLKALTNRLNALAKFFRKQHRYDVTDVRPEDLDDYAVRLVRRGAAHRTRCSYAVTVRMFFLWLYERGKILTNPARDLESPRKEEEPLPEPPLTEEQISLILDTMPRRDVVDLRNRLHLELLYSCGLRLSESVGLKLSDFDMENRCLRVLGKFGKVRVLPLMKGTMGALKDYLALRRTLLKGPDNGMLLLAKPTGKPLSAMMIYPILRGVKKRLQWKRRLNPHLFRHSIAVHLLQRGADIRHVQEFLAHASIDTTKIYLRLVPGRLKEDYEKAMPDIAIDTQNKEAGNA